MKNLFVFSLLLLCVSFCWAQQSDTFKKTAAFSHNKVRFQVSPPCDYSASLASPCNGQFGNKLPQVLYDTKLAEKAEAHVKTCPFFAPRDLDANTGSNFLVTWTQDTMTPENFIKLAVEKWGNSSRTYDFSNGRCSDSGRACEAFKQIIWSDCLSVGCAVNTQCDNGLHVAMCMYQAKVGNGAAYPALYFNEERKTKFKNAALRMVNEVRKRVLPLAKTALVPLQWDSNLALAAQRWADSLGKTPTFDAAINGKNGQLIYKHRYKTFANGAYRALGTWASRRGFYDISLNTCALHHKEKHICGEYTQMVDEKARKIGCGQAWYKGATYVVCNFDTDIINGRKHTTRPYTV